MSTTDRTESLIPAAVKKPAPAPGRPAEGGLLPGSAHAHPPAQSAQSALSAQSTQAAPPAQTGAPFTGSAPPPSRAPRPQDPIVETTGAPTLEPLLQAARNYLPPADIK